MIQADLLAAPPAAAPPLRDYQIAAVAAVERELAEHRGTLVLCATGTGKTQIAAELIRRHRGRACFIAHRTELIDQAARRIEQFCGVWPQIEKADSYASPGDGLPVVASIQSLARESRVSRFRPGEFSLVIVDEVHHATSATYRAVIDHFASAKIVGLTATPDRLDGEALGAVLDSVAYRYDLADAIRGGWLAPVRMRTVRIDGIDFSKIHTVAGDLNQGELDAVMAREEALHGVARPAVELSGARPTIVFTTSIENARRLAEIIDRYVGTESAVSVDSTLRYDERRAAFRLFESGARRVLVNVGLTTEGYDHPPTACIVLGRPTKSRALVTQMIGRGTRGGRLAPIPGKGDLLVIDFVGSTERHDIMGAVDALGGEMPDAEARLIKAAVLASDQEISIDDARRLAEERARKLAEQAAAHKRSRVKADVRYSAWDNNPFVALGVRRDYLHERYGYAAATDKQVEMLRKALGKHADSLPQGLGKTEASRMIGTIVGRREKRLCTLPQMYALQKRGIDAARLSFVVASSVLNALSKNNWMPLPAGQLAALVERQPGDDG